MEPLNLLFVFPKSGEKKITSRQAMHLAESEIIKKGLHLKDVEISEPILEEVAGNVYWSVKYTHGRECDEVLLSEYGYVIRDEISKNEAMKLAEKEFERRGLDLTRLKLEEESKKINGREYWVVRYTTSFGFSGSILISKKTKVISY